MTKRIYVLNGHPGETSLSRSLSLAYAEAAQTAGHEVRVTHLHDLSFDSDFGNGGYQNTKPLEPALDQVLEDLAWSEHVVLATPMWWGGIPAKLRSRASSGAHIRYTKEEIRFANTNARWTDRAGTPDL